MEEQWQNGHREPAHRTVSAANIRGFLQKKRFGQMSPYYAEIVIERRQKIEPRGQIPVVRPAAESAK